MIPGLTLLGEEQVSLWRLRRASSKPIRGSLDQTLGECTSVAAGICDRHELKMNMISNIAKIRLLIVDDHPMLREGVGAVIAAQPDMELAGEASAAEEGVALFRRLQPDVTLMDIQMPGMDGVKAIELIRADAPHAHILVLTTYAGDAQALRALRAGAAGYLIKSSLRRELIDAIYAVHNGRRALAPSVAQGMALNASEVKLSDREIAVLELVADGKANKEIARSLSISEDTVKSHLKNIYSKLEVDDRAHAVTTANRRGIISI